MQATRTVPDAEKTPEPVVPEHVPLAVQARGGSKGKLWRLFVADLSSVLVGRLACLKPSPVNPQVS
jgi:hypothetical protein